MESWAISDVLLAPFLRHLPLPPRGTTNHHTPSAVPAIVPINWPAPAPIGALVASDHRYTPQTGPCISHFPIPWSNSALVPQPSSSHPPRHPTSSGRLSSLTRSPNQAVWNSTKFYLTASCIYSLHVDSKHYIWFQRYAMWALNTVMWT